MTEHHLETNNRKREAGIKLGNPKWDEIRKLASTPEARAKASQTLFEHFGKFVTFVQIFFRISRIIYRDRRKTF